MDGGQGMKFYKLPVDIAARRDLLPSDKLVAAVIFDRIGNNDCCWPGVRTLSQDTGLSRPTIIDSLNRLGKKGIIQISRQGKGKVNHYSLGTTGGKETLPLKKGKWSRNFTTGGKETLPEAVKKLDHNHTDQLNQTQLLCPNSDEFRLSELLLNLILSRKPDFKRPNLQSWAKHIDRMIRLDRRTPERIEQVIRWCQQDSFWQSNILSTEKLREKFDQLDLKIGKQNGHRETRTDRGGQVAGNFIR